MTWFKKIKNFFFGKPSGERARDDKGRYIGDDPTTPHINEAYRDGRTPDE